MQEAHRLKTSIIIACDFIPELCSFYCSIFGIRQYHFYVSCPLGMYKGLVSFFCRKVMNVTEPFSLVSIITCCMSLRYLPIYQTIKFFCIWKTFWRGNNCF